MTYTKKQLHRVTLSTIRPHWRKAVCDKLSPRDLTEKLTKQTNEQSKNKNNETKCEKCNPTIYDSLVWTKTMKQNVKNVIRQLMTVSYGLTLSFSAAAPKGDLCFHIRQGISKIYALLLIFFWINLSFEAYCTLKDQTLTLRFKPQPQVRSQGPNLSLLAQIKAFWPAS